MERASHPVHHSAAEGYAVASDHYVLGRPGYPPEVTSWLRDTLGVTTAATVVDLGAGTGKFTRRLVDAGAQVIAIEPVDAMRAKISAAWPQVRALAGTATAIPLPDQSVDVIVCAQSFHWFGTAEALAEIRHVLKPGGRLGLIWNMRDENIAWVAQFNRIINQAEGDAPRYHTGAWRKAFPAPGFAPLIEQRFPHGHTGDPEQVIMERVRSTSFIAALPTPERLHIEQQVQALIDNEPALHGKATVTVPYETFAYHTRRTD